MHPLIVFSLLSFDFNKCALDTKAHRSCENFGASLIVFPMFLAFVKSKEIIKEREVL